MRAPFEDPRKADLRKRAMVALEASGHQIIDDPAPILLPPEIGLKGAIAGDIRTSDSDGVVYAHYVRTEASRPLPQWLANLATASHQLPNIRVFVIVQESTLVVEQSCRACGAGLLVVVDDSDYRLDMRVDPAEFSPEATRDKIHNQISAVRRRLETRLDLEMAAAKSRYTETTAAVIGMPADTAEIYLARAEGRATEVRAWADDLSVRLDAVTTSGDSSQLDSIARLVDRGPSTSEAEHVDR
jgi:hypothetical protein